jgi:hypothetical protein
LHFTKEMQNGEAATTTSDFFEGVHHRVGHPLGLDQANASANAFGSGVGARPRSDAWEEVTVAPAQRW